MMVSRNLEKLFEEIKELLDREGIKVTLDEDEGYIEISENGDMIFNRELNGMIVEDMFDMYDSESEELATNQYNFEIIHIVKARTNLLD